MPNPVIGIDPSLRATGLAYKSGGQWYSYVFRGDDIDNIRAVISTAYRDGVRTAYIEDGYLGINPKTAKQLDQLRGELRAFCLVAGMDFHMVSPGEWQYAMLGARKFKKGEVKPLSIKSAESMGADINRTLKSGKKRPDDNLADAVNLSEYGRLQEELCDV